MQLKKKINSAIQKYVSCNNDANWFLLKTSYFELGYPKYKRELKA